MFFCSEVVGGWSPRSTSLDVFAPVRDWRKESWTRDQEDWVQVMALSLTSRQIISDLFLL